MSISINWATKVIHIPQSDLTFISGSLYELDTNWFRLQLKDLEDSSDGIAFERTHSHNTEVTILGTTFARVIEIINGYSITFEDLPYSVKLVGSNNNFFDIDGGVLNRNQVQVVSTNSAGLIASSADREISQSVNFKDGVYLDVSSSATGTNYPNGTRTYPVNNLADALALCTIWNTSVINLAGALVLSQDVSGYEFISWKNGKIDINNQLCIATRFKDLKVYGTQATLALFYNCRITDLQGMQGVYEDCKFLDTIPLTMASANVFFNNCRSEVPGSDSPVFDYVNGNVALNMRAYSGGIKIQNSTHASNISTYEFIAGKFNFDNSNTAGEFQVRGSCHMNDTSAGTADVVKEGRTAAEVAVLSKVEEMNLI